LIKKTLIFYLTIITSGCSTYLSTIPFEPEKKNNYRTLKKKITNKLSFLPYIDYTPLIEPTENGKTLLDELSIYENIVNDHLIFGRGNKNNLDDKSKNPLKYIDIKTLFSKNPKETINEKKIDIKTIREITSRYEKWFTVWEQKTDLVGTELTIDEIDLIQNEIKRISRKL
tara:strand:+ start:248 stop:760 length:513 start_codon:yes stop_codon:yes gene_type:complete